MSAASERKKAWESRQQNYDNFERQIADIDAELVDIETHEKEDKALLEVKFKERTSLEAEEKKEEEKEAKEKEAKGAEGGEGLQEGGIASIEEQLKALDNLMDNLTAQKKTGHEKMAALTTKHQGLQSEILTLQADVNRRSEERHHRQFDLTQQRERVLLKKANATETKSLNEFEDTEINRALTGRARYTDTEAEELGRESCMSNPPCSLYMNMTFTFQD